MRYEQDVSQYSHTLGFKDVKYLKIDKLGPRSNTCLFIGYSKKIKGYYFYLTEV